MVKQGSLAILEFNSQEPTYGQIAGNAYIEQGPLDRYSFCRIIAFLRLLYC